MSEEFSAQHFADMPHDKFAKEAERLGVDLYGKSRTQQIDAVYNAELRRRQEQAEESQPEQSFDTDDNASAYDEYTVAELRDLADERGVDLDGVSRKADIIAALEAADEAQG